MTSNCTILQCCCSNYEVFINSMELSNIIGLLPYVSKYSSFLKSDKNFANIFGDEGRNTYSIDKNNKGFCAFGYRDKGEKILCSLHKAAVDMKIPLKSAKPLACILWPLAIVESDIVILSIQDDALLFPCNQERISKPIELDDSIAQIVKNAFGSSFLYQLEKIIEGLHVT
ncbi:MAG: hypothetical protein KJ826_08015 [Proteobacteria bacterium]|nr:hypothetical protein [Pseudomonadota bacterium]